MAHIHGFVPYFFIEVDTEFTSQQCTLMQQRLTDGIKSHAKYRDAANPIISVRHCLKSSIYGYSGDQKSPFLKVTVAWPRLVTLCRGILMSGTAQQYKVYDNNIDFCVRFMVDSEMVGASWVEFPRESYTIRSDNRASNCQLEVDISWVDIVCHGADQQWCEIAPIRVLSFDVEYKSRGGLSPDPEHDAVIQIANLLTRYGSSEPILSSVFNLDMCAPLIGSDVYSHDTEEELLEHWSSFIRLVDPDIITGYNVQNLHLPYLINRSKTLKIEMFPLLGRVKGALSVIKESRLQSKQMGRREHKMVHMSGRIQLDLLQILQRDHKLRSYSLNAVSFHFLREPKQDLSFEIVTNLHNESDTTRRRLALYCLKKCSLVLRLLGKLMCLVNYIEMARVTGVPLSFLLTHGQQIKVLSQLLRKARSQDFVLPDYEVKGGDEYSGGLVLEPNRRFYNIPITVLDFASLYPSIMMAHNLCYTTLIQNKSKLQALGIKTEDYIETPYKAYFVKSTVRRGLLPEILTELIEARKKAKRELAQESDEFRKQVLDGRQLALKLSANSVYGFTGAQIGRLPCLAISASVTAFGREMIGKTRDLIEARFTTEHGYAHTVEIVYGDTDSVMCRFGVETVDEAISLGKEAAQYVSEQFDDPIRLEFEQVFHPYFLISKKRYAGIGYTRPGTISNKVDCRGLEAVRRDSCLLAANLVTDCVHKLLTGNRDSSIAHAQSVISDLLCNRVDLSQLIISKQLMKTDKEYSSSSSVAHAVLSKKLAARDKGNCPQLGDRVPYIVVAGRDKNISVRAEDPIYVSENNLPIDTDYYLHNQLLGPLLRIFEPVFGDSARTKLTSGAHMRSRTQQHPNTGSMSSFTVTRATCLGCKKVLPRQERSICELCLPSAHRLYRKESHNLAVLEDKFSKLWSECQRCSGCLHQEVLCTSRDCPIFFIRTKVQTEIVQQNTLVARLDRDLDW